MTSRGEVFISRLRERCSQASAKLLPVNTGYCRRGTTVVSSRMMYTAWTTAALVTVAAVLLTGVATAPARPSLARALVPVVRHRLEEGRLSPALVEELVSDFEDPELMDFHDAAGKREFDEYGHMRFGKRVGGEYDDYGHLRFGRSLNDKHHQPHLH